MIDNIVLRIHNLKKYSSTVNILHRNKKTAATQIFTDTNMMNYLNEKPIHAVFYHNSDHLELVNHRNSITLPSSHYELAYVINFKADFIEFNFSIPKYRFGSNLFQFIDYFSQMAEKQFGILMNFIQRWKGNFIDDISDYDLEIVRVDFCYNQFFVSKHEALRYMELQEKAFEKKARGAGSFKKYGTETLMLVTDRYSFKVYYKGAEFRKNDYRKLAEKNYKSYDLKKMVEIADRTLRYECTFRSSYMFYQWKQIYVEGRKRVKGSVYTYLYGALKIHNKKNIDAKKFFVKSRYDQWKQFQLKDGKNWPLNFIGDHQVTFTYDLFNKLYDEFWKHIRTVQIKTSGHNSHPAVKKMFQRVNREDATKVFFSNRKATAKNINKLMFYFDLSQKQSLKNYMKKGLMSERTYQRIMKVFNRVGLADYNPAVNLAKPELGYSDYKYYFGNFVV